MRKETAKPIAIALVIRPLAIVAVLATSLLGGAPETVVAQTAGVNLLTNGDFEAWDYARGHWPLMWGIPEVQICPGWQAFWVQDPPADVPVPENWKRPEFRDVKASEASYRVRSGNLAQKYFSFGGQHIAGLYQQVSGITPGTTLRFEAYMQTWGCMAGDQGWNVCPTTPASNSPSPFHTRVGIDPTGGNSPGAASVIWGPEAEAYDQWTHFQVEAVAQSSTVTVFTYSHADWWDTVFRMHNDVYIDDASLIALDVPPAEVAPVAPSEPAVEPPAEVAAPAGAAEVEEPAVAEPTAPAPPVPTSTPRPDGAVVHVVQSGDTLNAIALDYGVGPDEITSLNNIDDGAWLSIGQELVIALDPSAVTQPEPEPAGDTVASSAEVAGAAIAPTPTPQEPQPLQESPPETAPDAAPVQLTLPTPTPLPANPTTEHTAAPEVEPEDAPAGRAATSRAFPVLPLALAVVSGVAVGIVLNGRIKRH